MGQAGLLLYFGIAVSQARERLALLLFSTPPPLDLQHICPTHLSPPDWTLSTYGRLNSYWIS